MGDLDEFIDSKYDFLKSFCISLGWKFPLVGNDAAVTKPISTAGSSRKKHLVQDNFPETFDSPITLGNDVIMLTKEDLKICLETSNTNEASSHTKTSDLEKISLPITSSADLLTTFNPAQRLAIYDFVSKSTKCTASPLPLTEIDLIFDKKEASDANQEKSEADLQTEERNAKRRRINYKQAKKVHTSGKTQTEVMAQVINNQMEMYEEWLQETSHNATSIISHQRSDLIREEKGSSSTESRKKHHKSNRDRSRSPRREHGKKHKKDRNHKHKNRSKSPERSKRCKKHKKTRE